MRVPTKLRRWALKTPVVEVNVSPHCDHGCFVIWMGSPAIWRLGDVPLPTEPEDSVRFHTRDCEEDICIDYCWGGE